jgi:hypothetical protein
MAPFAVDPTFAKVAFLQDTKDPGRMAARPGPPGAPQFAKAPAHDILASPVRDIPAHLNVRAIDQNLYAVDEVMARGATVGSVAEVQPLSDAPPASSPYGPVAPAWARRHPRLILAWACLRALRWVLRDFWRAFVIYVS